jgi:DnaJ-class molecular chaperone
MRDPYQTLGVDRAATAEDIKRAYRRLAAQHHPDRGGDTARFQEIQQAYDAITNPAQQFQQPHPQQHGQQFGGFSFNFGFDDIFSMFTQQAHAQQRRSHVKMTLWIDLSDAITGGKRTVSVGTQLGVQAIDIEIPMAINDGDHVQYPGLAPGGQDLVVEFRIKPNSRWHRQDLDLITDHHCVIWDLMLGTDIVITDATGQNIQATVPPMTQPNTLLRLRGQGIRDRSNNQGDILIRVHAVLPSEINPALLETIRQYTNK